jgi:hypothetical protein
MPSEFRTPLIVGGAVIGLSAIVAAVAVLSPEPPPTTTYEAANGESVTVSWEDYPANSGYAADEILAAPAQGDVVARWDAMRLEIEERLVAWDLDFAPALDDGWFPQNGNGYGGASSLISYNSEEQLTTGVPPREDWPELVAIVDGVLAEHGMAPLGLDVDDPQGLGPDEWLLERYGSTDPDEWSVWNGTAYSNGEWLSLTIRNDDLFPGEGSPETDAERGEQWVSFSYGATTVPDSEREAFERRIEPFRGLDLPASTSSG